MANIGNVVMSCWKEVVKVNAIEQFAGKFSEYEIPYGFVSVNPLPSGMMEHFDGFFSIKDGIHKTSGYFLVTDFNREEGYYSLSVFSPKNKGHRIIEFEVYYGDFTKNDMEPRFKNIRQESTLYAEGVMKILHVLVYVTIFQKPFEHVGNQSWHMNIDKNRRRHLEWLLRSNFETIISSLQMFIS